MSNNITREEISEAIFNDIGLSKSECNQIVDEIIEEISLGMINEGFVKIPSFGTFKIRQKNERQGRNPKTKEPAIISSRKVILFKVSHQLKRHLNE